jgi:acylglycerol lipase
MTQMTEPSPAIGTARMADGVTLRTLHWEAVGDPWATVEIVHGLGEHGGRYETVAAALTAAGIDVWSYDHRGNGGSSGPRGWVDTWPVLWDDLDARTAWLRERRPDLPLVVYAHSLGGLIATGDVLAERDRRLPDALVLSAPSFDDNLAGWKHALASLLAVVVPRMKLQNGVPRGAVSRDPAIDLASEADPLCSTTSTVKMGALAFKEQDRVRAVIAGIDAMPIPTLVIHGLADTLVPPSASARLEGKGNVTRRVYDGLRHECHHEPEHADVLADVVGWLRTTLSGIPAQALATSSVAGDAVEAPASDIAAAPDVAAASDVAAAPAV